MKSSFFINHSFLIIFMCLVSSSKCQSIINTLPGFHGDLPFTLETGYVGVGKDNQVQLFYYFVESQRDSLADPLLLYLTGGPGTSGLAPFLYQFGPLSFNFERSRRNNITLDLNPNSLNKVANIIFLDAPAGVGFSYAKTWEASRSSDSTLALHSYDFLKKWLVEHPRFLNNPLYISGVSYMGIVVPIVALEVYNGNERGDQPQLNIKGCVIVSPIADKFIDFNSRFEYAHRLALISDEIYESTKETCRGNYIYNDPSNNRCSDNLQQVDKCTNGINLSNILEPLCDAENPEPTCREARYVLVDVWANDKDVQKALHVREVLPPPNVTGALHIGHALIAAIQGTIETWEKTNETLHFYLYKNDTICYSYDIFSSIIYYKQLATKSCRVLILSGDHDMTAPYVGTQEWIASLELPIERAWDPWYIGIQIGGYEMTYAKNGYSLTYATVKGAGHPTALYKPEETVFIVDRWLAAHTSPSDT